MRVLLVARVTVPALVVRRRMASRWVWVVLVRRRIRVAVAVAIGVVGLQEILRNLIARVMVDIRVVAAARATPQQKLLLCCMLKA
jgi:hypothetical protein